MKGSCVEVKTRRWLGIIKYQHGQNGLELGILIELIAKKSEQNSGKYNETLKTPLPSISPSFSALLSPRSSAGTQGMGIMVISWHVVPDAAQGGESFLCLCGVLPTGDSSSWISSTWVHPMNNTLSRVLQRGSLFHGVLQAQPVTVWAPARVTNCSRKPAPLWASG